MSRAVAAATPWYQPVAPPAALEPWLACSWNAVPTGRHRLVPDACLDALWLSSGEVVLCGPETSAWTFQLPPGVHAAGVRFRPGVVPQLFGVGASTLLDRRVQWAEFVGAAAAAALSAELSEAGSDQERLAVWHRAVATVAGDATVDPLAEAVLALLVQHPRVRTAEVAAMVGLTTRQLQRRCLHSFGYGAATLARIVRFHRFWSAASLAAPGTPIAAFAHDAGYADHAHLVRDCRAITGLPPGRFLAESFATFPDMSDPYKTGRRLVEKLSA
ncbi:MAG: helix-turn-helix domain-containing protein [Ilumatobacteraceae bacterium]